MMLPKNHYNKCRVQSSVWISKNSPIAVWWIQRPRKTVVDNVNRSTSTWMSIKSCLYRVPAYPSSSQNTQWNHQHGSIPFGKRQWADIYIALVQITNKVLNSCTHVCFSVGIRGNLASCFGDAKIYTLAGKSPQSECESSVYVTVL